MNSSLVVKSLIGIGVAGGIAGGSAYALMPSNTKNLISEKLIENKYTILTNDQSNKSKWDEIILSYKAESTPETLKFADFKGDEADAVTKLQNKCNELLKPSKEEALNNSNYKKAEKWCVEPITLSDLFKKRNKTVFNVEDTDKGTHKDEWKAKIIAHKAEQVESKKIKELLGLSSGQTVAEDGDITKIKAECKKIGAKKNHEDKYDESLSHFQSWCSE